MSFPPKKLEITTPMRTLKKPRGRIQSDNTDPQRTVRMSDLVVDAIDEAARFLGITRSEFIRWVSYASANEVIRARHSTK